MEDISRELEREIARAKPTPYKSSRKRKVLVVDDTGELKSGTYLKVMVRLLSVVSLVFGLTAGGLYFLYSHQTRENSAMRETLAILKQKTDQLTNEKEILMARVVMAGKNPALDSATAAADGDKATKIKAKKTEVMAKPSHVNSQPAEIVPEQTPVPGDVSSVMDTSKSDSGGSVFDSASIDETSSAAESKGDNGTTGAAESKSIGKGVISVEKFSIARSQQKDDLRVRFDIRNIKQGPGEISGRIFLVLKPEKGGEKTWTVVPSAPLKNGIPSAYKRGQYFSISRFKPVKFTISSPPDPEDLKKAAVYIFDDEGKLVFKDVMDINLIEEE